MHLVQMAKNRVQMVRLHELGGGGGGGNNIIFLKNK
jgi:hypothetical protein